jgi:hypothetical protein
MSAWVIVDRLRLEHPLDGVTDLPAVARDAWVARTDRVVDHIVTTVRDLPGAGLVLLGERLGAGEGPDVDDARARLHRGLRTLLDAGHRVLVDPSTPPGGEVPPGCETLGHRLRLPAAAPPADGSADAGGWRSLSAGAGLVASSVSWGDLAHHSLEPVLVRDVTVDARAATSVDEVAVRLSDLGRRRGPAGPLTAVVVGRARVLAPTAVRARLARPGVAERLIASIRAATDPATGVWWEQLDLPPTEELAAARSLAGTLDAAAAPDPAALALVVDLLAGALPVGAGLDLDAVTGPALEAARALRRAVTAVTVSGPTGPRHRLDEAEASARARLTEAAGSPGAIRDGAPPAAGPGHRSVTSARPLLLGVTAGGALAASAALAGGRNLVAVGLGSLSMLASLAAFVTSPPTASAGPDVGTGTGPVSAAADPDRPARARAARLDLALTARRRQDLERRVATWTAAADLLSALVGDAPTPPVVPLAIR